MAGGSAQGLLQTPSWVLAIVFGIFLLISLALEHGLHFLEHMLRKRNKISLVNAVNKIKQELMILGFISLLLIAFGKSIEHRCVDRADSWWPIQTANGGHCPSCLETTKLDKCYLQYNECPAAFYDKSSYSKGKSTDDHAEGSYTNSTTDHSMEAPAPADSSEAHHRRKLMAAGGDKGTCNGGLTAIDSCPAGQEPLLTFLAQEQVHILLFLLAVIHIFATIILLVLAYFRSRQWHRYDASASMLKSAAVDCVPVSGMFKPSDMENGNRADVCANPITAGANSHLPSTIQVASKRRNALVQRPEDARYGIGPAIVEAFSCFFMQFCPNPISRTDLQLLSASFVYTHNLQQDFSFMHYVGFAMEEDYTNLAGLSSALYLFTGLVVLLSGVAGWIASWLNLAGMLLLVLLNARLLHIIRYAVRGGRVNDLRDNVFWTSRPRILLRFCRAVMFCASFIFASQAFMAWQFGNNSCYFNNWGFRAYAVWPFWVDTIFAILVLIMLSVTTLPLYALAVQIGAGYDPSQMKKAAQQAASKAGIAAH